MASEHIIKLLIVDDIPETRENLKKLLYFENDIEVIGAAESGEQAIEMTRDLQPDVILMDINMPGIDGISTVEHIRRQAPGTQVIMMSVQGEADYLRRSMLAGAREFLIKPFTAEELCTSIRRVHELQEEEGASVQARPAESAGGTTGEAVAPGMTPGAPGGDSRRGHVVCAFGSKGGVGTSTILVNTAIALATGAPSAKEQRPNARIVIVDFDLQFGSIEVFLNLESDRSCLDLASHIDDADAQFVEDVLVPHTSGVRVLLAPSSPEDAELITPDIAKGIIELLRKQFDFILVDTQTSLNELVLATLDTADMILLFTTAEIPSIKNTKAFFDVAEQLGYAGRHSSKITLVLNKYDQPRGRAGISAEAIQNSIHYPITVTIPAERQVTSRAINQGVPFVLSQSRTEVAQAVNRLAAAVVNILEPEQKRDTARIPPQSARRPPGETPARPRERAEKKDRSLFGRLFGRS